LREVKKCEIRSSAARLRPISLEQKSRTGKNAVMQASTTAPTIDQTQLARRLKARDPIAMADFYASEPDSAAHAGVAP